MFENFDILIIGCGFSGAVAARWLADTGKRVLILEKRNHIAGNMFDYIDGNGVLVHKYGPHIFHTNNKKVFDFLRRFSDFFPYEHRVIGKIDGHLVPIPFNFKSADLLFGQEKSEKIKDALKNKFGARERVSVSELLSSEGEIRSVGEYVFEKVFLHYTAKQWGMPAEQVDKSVLSRVPVVIGDDDRYFSDDFQFMPSNGYTKLFENLLASENITVKLCFDAQNVVKVNAASGTVEVGGVFFSKPIIWTAPADELFGCIYGRLPYRSLYLKTEQFEKTWFQPAAVVNYPNEEEFTRITEFKHMTGQRIDNATTIMKEYPMQYDPDAAEGNIPYYPIVGEKNQKLYEKYAALAAKIPNLHLCGRLAQYRYYNMDAAVAEALSLAEKLQ